MASLSADLIFNDINEKINLAPSGHQHAIHQFALMAPSPPPDLAHPVLGPRLVENSEALLGHSHKSAHEIFGSPDDVKLKSSMTLYASVSASGSVFEQVLAKFFGGERDPEILRRLA